MKGTDQVIFKSKSSHAGVFLYSAMISATITSYLVCSWMWLPRKSQTNLSVKEIKCFLCQNRHSCMKVASRVKMKPPHRNTQTNNYSLDGTLSLSPILSLSLTHTVYKQTHTHTSQSCSLVPKGFPTHGPALRLSAPWDITLYTQRYSSLDTLRFLL